MKAYCLKVFRITNELIQTKMAHNLGTATDSLGPSQHGAAFTDYSAGMGGYGTGNSVTDRKRAQRLSDLQVLNQIDS